MKPLLTQQMLERFSFIFIANLFAISLPAVSLDGFGSEALLVAAMSGAAISAIFSVRTARRKQVNSWDAAMTMMIAVLSGVSFGYYGTPAVSSIPLMKSVAGFPQFTALILAISGSQFVEFIMGGGLISFVKKRMGVEK